MLGAPLAPPYIVGAARAGPLPPSIGFLVGLQLESYMSWNLGKSSSPTRIGLGPILVLLELDLAIGGQPLEAP